MTDLLHPARVLQFFAALVPPLAVIAPRGLAVVLPLAAVIALFGAWTKGALRPPPATATAIVAAFLGWAAASALWAPEPRLVWSIWPQITGLAACGMALVGVARGLDQDSRDRIGLALASGVAMALALLLLEWASSRLFAKSLGALLHAQFSERPFFSYIFNRSTAALALLVWPAAFALHRRLGWTRATLFVAATLLIVSRFDSMAAIVGVSGGLVTWLVFSWPRHGIGAAVAAVLAIVVAFAPSFLPDDLFGPPVYVERTSPLPPVEGPVSVTHRLKIWDFVGSAIAERPLLGWGLNGSRDLPGGNVEVGPGASRLPLHPHNAFLQVWVELGAIGVALAAALGITALRAVLTPRPAAAADTRCARAAPLALMVSGCLVAGVGYGIWQGWWMAILWLAAAFTAAIVGTAKRDTASAP